MSVEGRGRGSVGGSDNITQGIEATDVEVVHIQSSSRRRCWRTWAAVSCRVGRR